MSDAPPTPEARAEALVSVTSRAPGHPHFIRLDDPSGRPVLLGPYENPAVAQEEAKAIRRFVASVLREAGRGG